MSRFIAAAVLAGIGGALWLAAKVADTPAAKGGLHALGALALAGVCMVVASAFTGRKNRTSA